MPKTLAKPGFLIVPGFFSQTLDPQEYPFDQHSGLKRRDLLSVLFYKNQKNQTKTKTPKPPPIGIMEV